MVFYSYRFFFSCIPPMQHLEAILKLSYANETLHLLTDWHREMNNSANKAILWLQIFPIYEAVEKMASQNARFACNKNYISVFFHLLKYFIRLFSKGHVPTTFNTNPASQQHSHWWQSRMKERSRLWYDMNNSPKLAALLLATSW